MADIFISYSSKDRAQAEQLTELLASAGLSVWIDREGIGAATSWSEEIVHALDECKAFVVMLSPSSIESKNVVRELALAFEKNKKILPLDLEPVTLPASMQYHLAGLQRTPMTNIDSIIRAIGKLGLAATQAPRMQLIKDGDTRKSLMILPFEDLSPTGDNGWFADGIVSELIGALSTVKALRIADNQATKEFKSFHGQLSQYAQLMNIRYFLQGDVRKFGDQIKISSRLLDIETGDYLWNDTIKGTMEDIFEMQERVAKNVLSGLHVILTPKEQKRLNREETVPEAYEFYLRGNTYFDRQTKAGFEQALQLYERAVELDNSYAQAHLSIVSTATSIYRNFSREPRWLEIAQKHLAKAETAHGDPAAILMRKSAIAFAIGDYAETKRFALEAIAADPEAHGGYLFLGIAEYSLGAYDNAYQAYTKCLERNAYKAETYFARISVLKAIGDRERLKSDALQVLPIFERQALLMPDNPHAQMQYIAVLGYAGYHEESLAQVKILEQMEGLDALTTIHLGCIYFDEGKCENAIDLFKKGIARGYRNIDYFLNDEDLAALRSHPQFVTMVNDLQQRINIEQQG